MAFSTGKGTLECELSHGVRVLCGCEDDELQGFFCVWQGLGQPLGESGRLSEAPQKPELAPRIALHRQFERWRVPRSDGDSLFSPPACLIIYFWSNPRLCIE
jgi:hypothetical protein